MCNGVDIFLAKCNFCHIKGGIAPVDLISADSDLFDRMKTVPSKATACAPRPLIDPALGPDGKATGIFFDRMTGTACGPRMPLGMALSEAEIACIRDWVSARMKTP